MINLAHEKILVTGGAGFIGSHLVDRLVNRNVQVKVLDNFSNGKRENLEQHLKTGKVELLEGDITKEIDIKKAVDGVSVIFHLACLGVRHSLHNPFENHRVNAEGTLLLLLQARAAGIKKFIHVSSSEVYGTALSAPMSEMHPTFPCTVYGGGKLAGECYSRAYFRTYGFPVVIARPFNTYGPRSHHEGDAGELIPKCIVRALNSKPMVAFGDGLQTRDFTYVVDMAQALVELALHGTIGQTYNIGSGSEHTVLEICQKIGQNFHNKYELKHLDPRPGDVLRLCADSGNFFSITKWRPEVSLSSGLASTIESFRSHPQGFQNLLTTENERNWV